MGMPPPNFHPGNTLPQGAFNQQLPPPGPGF